MVLHNMQSFLLLLKSAGKVFAGAFGGLLLGILLMFLHMGLTSGRTLPDEGMLPLVAWIILVPVGAYAGLIWARW